jgi:hypothetical protein
VGIELLERAVRGGGQLLTAEICPLGGRTDRVGALVLTFDLGRIAVSVEPLTKSLVVDYVESRDQAPPGLEDAGQEEPWWRLLGSPLARTWTAGPGHEGALCLQFRADDQSPRIVTLEPRGGSVSIRLESAPG